MVCDCLSQRRGFSQLLPCRRWSRDWLVPGLPNGWEIGSGIQHLVDFHGKEEGNQRLRGRKRKRKRVICWNRRNWSEAVHARYMDSTAHCAWEQEQRWPWVRCKKPGIGSRVVPCPRHWESTNLAANCAPPSIYPSSKQGISYVDTAFPPALQKEK